MNFTLYSLKEPKKKRNVICEESEPFPINFSQNDLASSTNLPEKYEVVFNEEKVFVEDQFYAKELNRNGCFGQYEYSNRKAKTKQAAYNEITLKDSDYSLDITKINPINKNRFK